MGYPLFSFSKKQDVECNKKETTYNSSKIECIFRCPIYHIFNFLTNNNDKPRNEEVNTRDVKAKLIVVDKSSGLIKIGEITPAVNHAAATVFKNSDEP